MQHADQLNKALRHQLEAGLGKKADAAVGGREGQSSRQQLTELWAEAEAARAGLDQVKGGLQQVQGQVEGLHDKVAVTKVWCWGPSHPTATCIFARTHQSTTGAQHKRTHMLQIGSRKGLTLYHQGPHNDAHQHCLQQLISLASACSDLHWPGGASHHLLLDFSADPPTHKTD